jgi:cell division protein FtsB
MKKTNIRKLIYHARHKYLTLNNVVIAVAFVIAASWVWGSLGVMQRNYDLQKDLDYKKRELQLAQLKTRSLELEKRYYQTREYQELAVREDLGLVMPGERVLVLPPNSQAAKDADKPVATTQTAVAVAPVSNLEQWMNFLFGANSKGASGDS